MFGPSLLIQNKTKIKLNILKIQKKLIIHTYIHINI
jgi:hypothetical protein